MTDPVDTRNWRRLDPRLTTSGQPSETQLAAIAALGVSTIVNLGLHTHPDALPDEAASVAALGMAYVHLPVDFNHPTRADLDAFFALMDAHAGQTIHVHCIANFRISAFIYRYRLERLGWDPAAARPDLDAVWEPQQIWRTLVEEGV